jgi:hypothetical protein
MNVFKSGSIDKISASQFLTFGVCTLLVETGVIASIAQLEKTLIDVTAESSRFRYVRMTSDVDTGYIVKRKT